MPRMGWKFGGIMHMISGQVDPNTRNDAKPSQTGIAFKDQKASDRAMILCRCHPNAMDASQIIRMSDDDKKRRGANGNSGNSTGAAVITKTRPQTKRPSLYRVLLLNDDYTPMEFVVHVLERFFNKDRDAATQIMLHVHNNGIGECGVFTYEVAETKVTQVMDFARKHQHPLQCVMEKK